VTGRLVVQALPCNSSWL